MGNLNFHCSIINRDYIKRCHLLYNTGCPRDLFAVSTIHGLWSQFVFYGYFTRLSKGSLVIHFFGIWSTFLERNSCQKRGRPVLYFCGFHTRLRIFNALDDFLSHLVKTKLLPGQIFSSRRKKKKKMMIYSFASSRKQISEPLKSGKIIPSAVTLVTVLTVTVTITLTLT